MFGPSVWLLVSVSGAPGSSDSAGGAAVPSRVQPSPCDTLSVTDPLCLVTWHPTPHPLSLLATLLASGLFAATSQSPSQSVTYHFSEESSAAADLHVFLKADTSVLERRWQCLLCLL